MNREDGDRESRADADIDADLDIDVDIDGRSDADSSCSRPLPLADATCTRLCSSNCEQLNSIFDSIIGSIELSRSEHSSAK